MSAALIRPGMLAGKVVVVTGAGRGLGVGIARGFARSGAHVCAIDIQTDELVEAKAEIARESAVGGGEHSYLAHMIFASDNQASWELAAAMGPNWTLVFRSATGSGNPSSMMGALGKGGITVELGGNCRLLTNDFHNIAQDLADGYLNVMRHYGMIDGEAKYALAWRQGYQIALLAPAPGMFVGSPVLPFETELAADTVLGVIFGLRSRASVLEGQWCCFFGVVEKTVDDLIP